MIRIKELEWTDNLGRVKTLRAEKCIDRERPCLECPLRETSDCLENSFGCEDFVKEDESFKEMRDGEPNI